MLHGSCEVHELRLRRVQAGSFGNAGRVQPYLPGGELPVTVIGDGREVRKMTLVGREW